MAGIGFDLRRLVGREQTYFTRCRAYASAAMIAAGPWIVTMSSLWLVRAIATWMQEDQVERFLAVVGNVFAMSLVTIGGLQMAVTRHLADALYSQRYGALIPAFATSTALVAALQATTGALMCWLVGFDAALTLATTLLYVAVSLTWLAMVWLTVIRQHDKILLAFVAGGLTFLAMLSWMGAGSTVVDVVAAYALSNGLIVALMAILVVRGTERATARRIDVVAGVWRHRRLVLVGAAYGLSLWVDKWVFWAVDGVATVGVLRHHPLYDACFYLAYLTVVPALSINLVHLETEFYTRYRGYYATIMHHRSLREIRRMGADMAATLGQSAGRLLRVQGAVTLACMAFARPLVALVDLPPYAARVFRLMCVGAFCHVMLLLTVLVLLYFDRQRAALRACVCFLVANLLLALWSVRGGPWTYGAGFAVAALIGMVVALAELRATFRRLDYVTFAAAP